jgi:YbbR domain-containing protein
LRKANILILGVSLLLAVILWGYVAFEVNPESTKTVTGISVDFINERELGNRNLMLVGGMDAIVDVHFTGRIQNLLRVSKDTVRAVVDLRGITAAGETSLEFVLEGDILPYLDYVPARSTVTLVADDVGSRLIDKEKLIFEFGGDIAEGYISDPPVFVPDYFHISGPEKELRSVSSVVVRFEPQTPIANSIVDRPVDYTLYDESGDVIQSDFISDDLHDSIRMTLNVFMVKTVPLKLENITYGGGLGAENIDVVFEPETVRIAGDSAALESVRSLPVDYELIASVLRDGFSQTVAIEYGGWRPLDDIEGVNMTVTIKDVSTREISTTNVVPQNLVLPAGYRLNIVSPVSVTLRGPKSDLDRVIAGNVRLIADFTDVDTSPAQFFRPVTVEVDGFDTVGAIDPGGGYVVVVEIVAIRP